MKQTLKKKLSKFGGKFLKAQQFYQKTAGEKVLENFSWDFISVFWFEIGPLVKKL